ncbi:MAG: right-handed parallel beta-helix repeat-containing protein, partial [Phycisphaerales bacterium]
DIDGEARVFAVRVDIGADEFVGYVKPVAFAGPDQHVAAPGLITLDGSGSHFDESAEQRDYMWSQEDGPPVELSDPDAMRPTFTPESEGLYLFELVVGDGTNLSEADEVIVLVGNKPPVANAGTNRICKVPERISLDGSASYDPDDIDDLTYSWRQVEGPSVVLHDAETAEPFFDCNEEGTYVFELVVNDGFVDSQPSLVKVTSVVFTLNQQAVDAGYQADGYFHYVDVSGAKVVYAVGMISDDSWDIKCKDLETGEVESFSGGGIDTQPKIDGDIVVWSGGPFITGVRDTECTSVFVRNVVTGRQRTLRQHSDTASYSHPAVSGNKVVWLQHINIDKNFPDDWSNMPYDICGADITDINNPVYFTVAERVDNRDPYPVDSYAEDFDGVIDISGDIVVWEAEGDIYGADISDLAEIRSFQICIDEARQYDPAISGNVVVWTDERNDDGDIYGADISDIDNVSVFQIAGGVGSQLQPATDGCLVVYIQGSIYGGLIKAACLTRANSVMDVELLNSPVGTGPAVDGQTVIWQTSIHGQVQAVSVGLGYSISDGPVENVTSGRRYDYIQHAVNAADIGDRIVASPGVYRESVKFKGKNLEVVSSDPRDPDVSASTIIRSSATVVTFSGVDANCILAGFSITGGARGIYCSGASPTIANCTIAGNRRSGMELRNSSKPAITNCSLVRNGAAGIEMWPLYVGRFTYYNWPVLTNCLIAENAGDGVFGGVPTVTGCTVAANRQSGISALAPTVTNSVVFGNGPDSEGVQIKAGFGTVSFSDVQGSWPGTGNIDADPLFVRLGEWQDSNEANSGGVWIPGDYHLLAGSPCVDAGDPAYVPGPNETDLDGKPRLTGPTVDMGAFELGPVIGLSEQQLTFETELGMPNPSGQTFYIRNIGAGTFEWEIDWRAEWLDVDQRTGVCHTGLGNPIRLTVDTTGLAAGLYESDITISAASAGGSPQGCHVKLVINENCFPDAPEYARQYADYMDYLAHGARAACWCASPSDGTQYQCDGDADGKDSGLPFKYRVFTGDLSVIVNNWRKKMGDATLNPCADVDHRAESPSDYRVFTGDLSVVVANWRKRDSEVPNDCPRPDSQ